MRAQCQQVCSLKASAFVVLFPGVTKPKTAPILEHFHLFSFLCHKENPWQGRAHEEGQTWALVQTGQGGRAEQSSEGGPEQSRTTGATKQGCREQQGWNLEQSQQYMGSD